MEAGMIAWIIIVCLVGLGLTFLIGKNFTWSLIRKWKHNPGNWFDLLVGIVVSGIAAGAVWWIIIKFIMNNLP